MHLAMEIVEKVGCMYTVFLQNVSIGENVHFLLFVRVSLSAEIWNELWQG